MTEKDWRDFGENIRCSVDSAISSGDFSELSRTIGNAINDAIDSMKDDMAASGNPSIKVPPKKQQQYQAPYDIKNRSVDVKSKYWNTNPSKLSGILGAFLGGTAAAFSGILSLFCLAAIILDGPGWIAGLIIFGIFTALGIFATAKGLNRLKLITHFRKITRFVNNQVYIPIKELASQIGVSPAQMMKELKQMLKSDYFYEGHVDEDNGYFIVTNDAYAEYMDAKIHSLSRQNEMRKQESETELTDECQKLIRDGNAYVAHIHRCNEQIPDEVMTDKLNRMETLVNKIFAEVKEHPEVAPDLSKMINYYLPTTEKLLDAYRELDDHPESIAGDNILNTKREIEESVDTLNTAFEKLFDKLFAERALDISTDISVLNTILSQEGLTEDGLQVQSTP